MKEREGVTGAHAVLLHGFTGSARSWEESTALEGFGTFGIDALPIDLPGHGAEARTSPGSPVSLDTTLAAIHRWLRPATSAARSHLIGYSMGGRLALHHAVRYPGSVARLVLESASPGLEGEAERSERRAADEALARQLESAPIEDFVDRWESLPLFASQGALPDEVRARVRAGRLANDPRSLAAALRGLGTGTLPSLWDDLPRLETEVLVLVGALDSKFLDIGERMVARLPRGRLVVVPGAGHTVHLEAPDVWRAEVARFLTSGGPSPA